MKVPNRTEKNMLFRPYMEDNTIWSTDSWDEVQDMLGELNKVFPEELLFPMIMVPWSADISVEKHICDDSSPIIVSPDQPEDQEEGTTWYEILP